MTPISYFKLVSQTVTPATVYPPWLGNCLAPDFLLLHLAHDHGSAISPGMLTAEQISSLDVQESSFPWVSDLSWTSIWPKFSEVCSMCSSRKTIHSSTEVFETSLHQNKKDLVSSEAVPDFKRIVLFNLLWGPTFYLSGLLKQHRPDLCLHITPKTEEEPQAMYSMLFRSPLWCSLEPSNKEQGTHLY